MNLNQITIKSKDVNCAVEFYKKLGLQLIVDSRPRYVRFESPEGESTFSISHDDQVKDVSTTIYFEVDNIDRVYNKIKGQSVNFTSPPEDKKWLWREASLKDPDGHPLIIFSAGNNRKCPPWRLVKKRWFEYFADSPVNLMK